MKETKKTPLNIVQPNKVTYAKYDFNEREENILTLIIDAVQQHLTNERPIETDLFKQPAITIETKGIDSVHKSRWITAARSLRKKDIVFEWTDPETNKTIETETSFLAAHHDIKGTSKIQLTISTWAIPYLVYWGKEVGGTIFNKQVALTLKGEHTKRLYKLCCRWADRGGFTMPEEEFRQMFGLENKYPRPYDLRRRVFDPAKKRMQEKGDLWFDYQLEGGVLSVSIHTKKQRPGGKKKADMENWYSFLYRFLHFTYPHMKSSKAKDICDSLAKSPNKLRQAADRFERLNNELNNGEKDIQDVIKLTKTILKNDFNIN